MTNSRYWDRVQKSRLSRRAMLAASARAGVGAAGLTLVGCGDDGDGAAQQQQAAVAAVDTAARTHGATLRIGWDLALSGYRGPYAQSQHGAFHTPVWDTLIRYPFDSLEPEARLAESWEFNGDQTVLPVNLRRLQNLDWAVSGYTPSMEKFWLKA